MISIVPTIALFTILANQRLIVTQVRPTLIVRIQALVKSFILYPSFTHSIHRDASRPILTHSASMLSAGAGMLSSSPTLH
ncbi:hypothetical protein C8J56DRAFT_970422 [Mycena floridula]|nr:hypothetical protein C8J56DRAFT_970422 [Mycena floridula]